MINLSLKLKIAIAKSIALTLWAIIETVFTMTWKPLEGAEPGSDDLTYYVDDLSGSWVHNRLHEEEEGGKLGEK